MSIRRRSSVRRPAGPLLAVVAAALAAAPVVVSGVAGPAPAVPAAVPAAAAIPAAVAVPVVAPGVGSAAVAAQPVTVRVRFGMKDADPTDWGGKVDVAGGGSVESIRGVRWMPGDHASGNEFAVQTRRQQPQNAAARARQQANGVRLPMNDNGIVVTLAGATPDTSLTIDAKPGKATVKLVDLTLGKRVAQLDGRMEVERVPAAAPLAETPADEDYPAAATAPDGTVYVAYLAFTRGKDFQGARERPATPESGPVTGPLAAGEIRKIEKPEDFDYLTQPTGGEQLYLRTCRNGVWGEPVAVADGKLELYRPAVAVDGGGNVWVFYSAHVGADATLDHGNWELMAQRCGADGKPAGAAVNVSHAPGSDFMPAACTAADGRAWVTWVGAREGGFHVFTAVQDGERFGEPKRVSEAKGNEWEPSIAASPDGRVAVGWDTYDKGDYDVYLATADKSGTFGKPQAVAASAAFEVRPSLSFDAGGRLWVAYEATGDGWGKDFGALKKKGIPLYQSGRYLGVKVLGPDGAWSAVADPMTALTPPNNARRGGGGGARARAAAAAGGNDDGPGGQLRVQIAPNFPRLTTDPQGHVWLAFRGKPGGNWRVGVGSVWCEYVTRLDATGWSPAAWVPRSNNVLDNRPALARLGGPAGSDVMLVYSGDGRGELNPPKVGDPHLRGEADGDDQVEAALAREEAALALLGPSDEQTAVADAPGAAKPAPNKPAVPEKPVDGGADNPGAGDAPADPPNKRANRPAAGARRGAGQPDPNNDLFVAVLRGSDLGDPAAGPPALRPAPAVPPTEVSPDTALERKAVQAMRDYRVNLGTGEQLRLWRGEFHRHTEYSPDGGGDGGLLDLWRYAIDSADLDWIGDGDHDYGNGREYSWWTTQKAVTLFTLPGRFTPMYCYERSVVYPEGHRNCMFAQRGVRSLPRLPLSAIDAAGPAPDTLMLYRYLHHFNGLCASHTSATDMGTDWRNNDPLVEPFVEIYQGDRNNYERPDAPRSAVTEAALKQSTPDKESLGGWRPKGFVNLALLKGYRLAFESSSDHISTHLAYCNVLIAGEPTREAVLEAIKKRRVYGSTDNLIADVRCTAGGKTHWMGEEFSTDKPPTLDVHLVGAQRPIAKVVIVKDDVVVHEVKPGQIDVKFTWTDPNPTPGKTSYYYVRGEQAPDLDGVSSGELVWASPMWIQYEGK